MIEITHIAVHPELSKGSGELRHSLQPWLGRGQGEGVYVCLEKYEHPNILFVSSVSLGPAFVRIEKSHFFPEGDRLRAKVLLVDHRVLVHHESQHPADTVTDRKG